MLRREGVGDFKDVESLIFLTTMYIHYQVSAFSSTVAKVKFLKFSTE